MNRTRYGFAILLALTGGCAGASDPSEPSSATRSAIHHGQPASDPNVVALVKHRSRCDETEPEVVCSGVLIGERLVLTAAHCLSGLVRGELEVRFGTQPSSQLSYRGIVRTVIHPQYDRQYDDHDLALVWLDMPAPAEPVSFASGELDPSVATRNARVVGFGEASGGGGMQGQELDGAVVISAIGDTTLEYAPGNAMTCHGDSGGPLFLEQNGHWVLVGITTSGDADCESAGVAVRVDVHQADFIAPALAQPVPVVRVSPSNVCSDECASNADCPGDLVCEGDGETGLRCLSRDVGPVALLEACTTDDECASNHCLPIGAECRCSQACGGRALPAATRTRGCQIGLPAESSLLPSLLGGALLFARRVRRRRASRRPFGIRNQGNEAISHTLI